MRLEIIPPNKYKSNLVQNLYHSSSLLNLQNPPEFLKLMKQITNCIQTIHH